MEKKVVIVGGVAGGASAAARLRRLDECAQITLFEKGEYISYANCGLPYHIGGVIPEREDLLVQTPERMEARFKLSVQVKKEVIAIEREKKEVKVKDLVSGEVFRSAYDYLILSPGAEPFMPPIKGIDRDNVFTLRTIPDTDRIKDFVEQRRPEKAVVIGGGYIGLEMVENLQEKGIQVAVAELLEQVINPLDYEMAAMVHNHLRMKGVSLYLKDGVSEILSEKGQTVVVLASGKRLTADLIILSIGVRPVTELARQAGLELGQSGGIKVNHFLQTSDPNIYAIGDAIEVNDLISGQQVIIPLAGPANKQGRIVADNIAGGKEKYHATQGTAIAKVFDLTVATTGNNQKQLDKRGVNYQVSYTNSNNHAGYYPGAVPMLIKLIFTAEEGRLLGAQIVGQDGVDKRIDLLATALKHRLTVFDLQELELAYAPPYGSAKDPVNMAGYVAGNILKGLVQPIQWHQIAQLDQNTVLLDVREEVETKYGKIEGSLNIPLNSLRERLGGLEREQAIVVYCSVGLRAYLACRILSGHGFTQVKNLAGGYKLYRAVQDDQNQVIREPEPEEIYRRSETEEGMHYI
ncbi:MAG: FAD-dependent oxidoreductase [Halanaerobiales bacterium]|nr:FAD-dependent oxidoreductase [Halanaerobiales bacterium]